MAQSISVIVKAANEAACTLQRHIRARRSIREALPGEPQERLPQASGAEARSFSPTTIATRLVGQGEPQPLTPAMPLKLDAHAALHAAGISSPALLYRTPSGAAPPLPPQPPPALPTMNMRGGIAPPLPPGPPPAYSAASTAAAAGLTIQAPNGSSPPFSPASQQSVSTSSGGLMLSPLGQPSATSPVDGPHQLPRPHQLDENALLSPQTPWQPSRVQSRLPVLGMGSAAEQQAAMSSAMAGAMGGAMGAAGGAMMYNSMNGGINGAMGGLGNGLGGHSQGHSHMMPGGVSGGALNGMGSLHQRPAQPPLSPEQQRIRLVSQLVMERLCVWGEYRTVGEWPQELVAHGAMPAVQEALQVSPTRSLTIPQLVTAIKERTGNAHGGKALDMLNLKAYVRCYPALFHLRSGRTSAGRPLDVVELRIDCSAEGGPIAHSAANSSAQPSQQRYHSQPGPGMPPLPPGCAQSMGGQGMGGQDVGGQQAGWSRANAMQFGSHPAPAHSPTYPAAPLPKAGSFHVQSVEAAPAASPNGGAALQPKELFATASEGDHSPRSLWGSPALGNGFSLFGGPPSPAPSPASRLGTSDKFAAAFAPSAAEPPAFAEARHDAARLDADAAPFVPDEAEEQPAAMMAQLDALLAGSSGAADADGADSAVEARQAYIRLHSLDKLFTSAVDRAMRHKVASPIEFVAHELLRHCEA